MGANLANIPEETVTVSFARLTAALARYLQGRR